MIEMALVTIQRSPSTSSVESAASLSDSEIDKVSEDGAAEEEDMLSSIKSPAKSRRLVRQGSVSENFFAVKGAMMILPKQTSMAIDNMPIVKFEGELQTHLRAIFHHLRPQDNIKLAVRLESWTEEHRRYLVIISTTGRQDTEESIIVGCDFATRESTACTIGLVIPIWCDTSIRLDGDGGFKVIYNQENRIFKPVSVQAMWSALQTLHRCLDVAQKHNYYEGSLYLTWTGFYQSRVAASNRLFVNEWTYNEDLWSKRPNYFADMDPEREPIESIIRSKLKQVMMTMDLDNCTCKEIRMSLEKVVDMDLTNYKEYIDTHMLTVLGQMDCSSKILDYLYLGSEWNASNFEELNKHGITSILNVTLEIDNFFPDDFRYKNIRLYDLEESDLLPYWNDTWKFISEARRSGGKCLVHCKMGISRSGATVAAFLMKEKQWSKKQALDFVKARRSIVHPNPAFLSQLDEYEGILAASSQRHNKLFRSRSESSLSEPSVSDDHPVSAIMSPRPSAPCIQISDDTSAGSSAQPLDGQDFDLNRHLLDIASLNPPKVSRPKSWSPDEGRRPYNAPSNNHIDQTETPSDHYNGSALFPSSEPEFVGQRGTDPNWLQLAEDKRKSFTGKRAKQRHHTTTAMTSKLGLEELAHSEDSVFVHVGDKGHSGVPMRPAVSGTARRKSPKARASSPAALCQPIRRPDALDVTLPEEQHPSMSSPMNSPSYKNAMCVDIEQIKSRFSEPNTRDGGEPSDDAQSPPIQPQGHVKDIIAVIESPTEDAAPSEDNDPVFVKGHHKAASLPPANVAPANAEPTALPPGGDDRSSSPAARSRSLSEAQAFSVRKIVTEIESRNSPDPGTEARESHEGIHRTMSMPSSRRRGTSPLSPSASSCAFVPVKEVVMETEEVPGGKKSPVASEFYIGDDRNSNNQNGSSSPNSNSNNNNNNNNNNVCDLFEFGTETLILSTSLKSEEIKLGAIQTPVHPPVVEEKKPDPLKTGGPMSPELLLVIREVGSQLMSDSEESSRSSSFSTQFGDSFSATSHSSKKVGRVRQMAREIEKRVKKLARKASKSKIPKDDSQESEDSPSTKVINKLLMGDLSPSHGTPEPETVTSQSPTDVRVKELVDKFNPNLKNTSSPSHEVTVTSWASCPVSKDIASLLTAPPYKPRRVARGTSCSPPCVPRFEVKGSRVRRSQSDRSSWRPTWLPGAAKRLSATSISVSVQPCLAERETLSNVKSKSSDNVSKTPEVELASSPGVQDMIRRIETIKTSVHRSSSLPTTKGRYRPKLLSSPVGISRSSGHSLLTRSKSSPLLGFVKTAKSRIINT